ncbi:MAG: hypothetical protein HRT88_20010, partial [Lentisphaeraceae bacterium]|nr:hypothetical protein [Lentisphaeraceae bacterium]
ELASTQPMDNTQLKTLLEYFKNELDPLLKQLEEHPNSANLIIDLGNCLKKMPLIYVDEVLTLWLEKTSQACDRLETEKIVILCKSWPKLLERIANQ